jgi:hypothetical protein
MDRLGVAEGCLAIVGLRTRADQTADFVAATPPMAAQRHFMPNRTTDSLASHGAM